MGADILATRLRVPAYKIPACASWNRKMKRLSQVGLWYESVAIITTILQVLGPVALLLYYKMESSLLALPLG
jgi:hypothetical protein